MGLLFGMAVTIIVSQAAKIVGVSSGERDFFERLWTVLVKAPDWSLTTLAVGAGALLLLLLLERRLPRLPASLIVLVLGLVVSAASGHERHGVEIVGKIPSAIPVPHLPGIPARDWLLLAGGSSPMVSVIAAGPILVTAAFLTPLFTDLQQSLGGPDRAGRRTPLRHGASRLLSRKTH